MPYAFRDIPADAFPFTMRFYRASDGQLVHEIEVKEPA